MAAPARQSAKTMRQKMSLVDRFLVRDARVQTDRKAVVLQRMTPQGIKPEFSYKDAARGSPIPGKELVHGPAYSANSHNFQPHRHPVTGRWIPPRMSLRRQAQLAKTAYKEGTFDTLVETLSKNAAERDSLNTMATPRQGPTGSIKFDKMVERLQQLNTADQGRTLDSYNEGVRAQREGPPISTRAETMMPDTTAASSSTITPEKRKVYHHALAHAATSRVYSGRSMRSIFKGTKAEREAPARKRKIAERLAVMDDTIRAHKEGRREAKLKVKRKLPF